MIVHFICRGNGLRSTMAEAYLRSRNMLEVDVLSSGTAVELYKDMPVSPHGLAVLEKRGIDQFAKRVREQLTAERLARGDITIFMNERVAEEAAAIGPEPPYVEIWQITDLGEGERRPTNPGDADNFAEEMFNEIVAQIEELKLTA